MATRPEKEVAVPRCRQAHRGFGVGAAALVVGRGATGPGNVAAAVAAGLGSRSRRRVGVGAEVGWGRAFVVAVVVDFGVGAGASGRVGVGSEGRSRSLVVVAEGGCLSEPVAAGEIGFGSGMRRSLDSLPGNPGADRGLGSLVGVLCCGISMWTATADETEKASGFAIDGGFGFCAGPDWTDPGFDCGRGAGLAEMLTVSAA